MRRARTSTRVGAAFVATIACTVGLHACGLEVRGGAGVSPDAGSVAVMPSVNEGGVVETESQGPGTTCASEETACAEGACVNLQTSANNCGECGKVCPQGMVCEAAACVVFCEPNQLRCGAVCADPKADLAHCGGCDRPCGAGLVCSDGSCVTQCATGLSRCPIAGADTCVDLTRDVANCGMCGRRCLAGEVCEASQCRALCAGDGVLGDTFGPTMVGCRGRTRFSGRASYCPSGTHVCSAEEYVARRAGKRPTYNYWTNENLRYGGSSFDCRAVTSGGSSCGSDNPMRVCTGREDPLGNDCNWTSCGFQNNDPNEYFGGCVGNTTAGVLCCR